MTKFDTLTPHLQTPLDLNALRMFRVLHCDDMVGGFDKTQGPILGLQHDFRKLSAKPHPEFVWRLLERRTNQIEQGIDSGFVSGVLYHTRMARKRLTANGRQSLAQSIQISYIPETNNDQ